MPERRRARCAPGPPRWRLICASALLAGSLLAHAPTGGEEDPRWLLRRAVRTYLDSLQRVRSLRLAEALNEARRERDLLLSIARQSTPARAALYSLQANATFATRSLAASSREPILRFREQWTRDLGHQRYLQKWLVTERVEDLKDPFLSRAREHRDHIRHMVFECLLKPAPAGLGRPRVSIGVRLQPGCRPSEDTTVRRHFSLLGDRVPALLEGD